MSLLLMRFATKGMRGEGSAELVRHHTSINQSIHPSLGQTWTEKDGCPSIHVQGLELTVTTSPPPRTHYASPAHRTMDGWHITLLGVGVGIGVGVPTDGGRELEVVP